MMTMRYRVRRHAPRSQGRWRRALAGVVAASLASATLIGLSVTTPTSAYAAAGDPFDPSSPVVFIAQGSPSQLQRAETSGDGSFSFTDEGGPAPVSYNAIGFNPADNYLYAMVVGAPTAQLPAGALVRIGEGGRVTRVGTNVYRHPDTGTTRWYSGAFNPENGLYYISDSSPSTTMLALNVSTGAIVRTVDLGEAPGVQDFTFKDGYAWGANGAGDVRRMDVASGTVTVFPGVLPTASSGYGGVWNFGNGNLGFSSNATGAVTQLRIDNGSAASPAFTVVSTVQGPSSSLNDGTSIPGLPADLTVAKTGPATFVSGTRIRYDVTVTNNGAGLSSGWTVTDVLPAGLSNPTVAGDVSSSVAGSKVTVTGGRLGVGQSKTFTIEADTNVSPPACIVNTASVVGNEEDPNPGNNEGSARSCALALSVEKTSNATANSRPGDVVTYTVTATNTGAGDYTAGNPAVVFDDLSGVLDDAEYNADASASKPGTLGYQQPLISWSGALAVGESVDITYGVTLRSGGDGEVRNVTWVPGDPGITTPPTCDPATGGIDQATGQPCAVEKFELPRLTISKSVDRTELPAVGEQATFTVVVRNAGPGNYTETAPATASDDLSDVLDDATFDDASLTSSVGTVTRDGDTLSWKGAIAAGEQATITYSVTYTGKGDQILRNLACIPEDQTPPGTPSCDRVRVPGALLTQWKSAQPSSDPVVAGSTITYTLSFHNDGQAPASVNAVDHLTQVLDDATVTAEPTASAGLTAVRNGAEISITGFVPVGQTSTVTYTVTVSPDGQRGDSIAANFLLPPGETPPANGECVPTDDEMPDCTVTPITGVAYTKSVEASETPARVGTELTYTVVVTNMGATVVDVSRDDDLSDVLDDATLTGAATSDTDSVTVTGPVDEVLAIRGKLAVGATAKVTYTVTINGAGERGNNTATNFLVPPGTPPSGPCDPVTEQCTSTPIQGYTIAKSVDTETTSPGSIVTYTVTVTNVGALDYTDAQPASFEDDLSDVLDDATYNGDISAGGEVSDGTLTWAGPLKVGETLQVTYTVTVNNPVKGDFTLRNVVTPSSPGGECAEGSCVTETPAASYSVRKDVSSERALIGDRVTFTVTVTNIGQVAYTNERPASFTDDLSSALAVGVYNEDATGGAVYERPVLSWSGAVGVGESVSVSYSVTIQSVGKIRNIVVTPEGSGANCPDGSSDGDCATTTVVVPPGLATTGGAGWIGGGIAGAGLLILGLWLIARRRTESATD